MGRAGGAGATFDAYGRLGALAAPALVQHGDEDVVVDPRNADLLVEVLPDAHLERLPGRGTSSSGRHRSGSSRRSQRSWGRVSGTELTIGRWLAERAHLTPDRVAIRFLGSALTYAELDCRATRLAAGLAARGLRRGDRLATLTRTSPDHVATLFACARLGVALQPISWRLAPAEIAYQLEDAEPRLLLASADHAELAREAGTDVELARIGDPTLETDGEVGDVARRRRPVAPRLHVGDDRQAERRASHPRELLLDEPLVRPATSLATTTSSSRCSPSSTVGGWNVQPLLAWWRERAWCSSRRSTRRARSS